MKSIKVKINQIIPGHSVGSIISVLTDDKKIPITKFWRDRLRDAETDNCVEIIKDEPKKPEPAKTKTSKETSKEDAK